MRRIEGLDGLRGSAAMLVLFSHFSNEGFRLIPGLNLSGIGKSGVYLFFILSAFLLSSQIREAGYAKLKTWPFLARYCESRILRIWPLFIVVCLFSYVTTIFGWPALVEMNGSTLIRTLVLKAGPDHLWTIAVEFKFYFILPILMAIFVGVLRNNTKLCICAAFLFSGLFSAFVIPKVGGVNPLPFMSIFVSGVAANYIVVFFKEKAASSLGLQTAFELIAWGALLSYGCTIPSVYACLAGELLDPQIFWRSHFLFNLIWVSLIVGMLLGKGYMRRILDSRPFVHLGLISYSLYLWHPLLRNIAVDLTGDRLIGATDDYGFTLSIVTGALVLSSILFATISYRLIERPMLKLRRDQRSADNSSCQREDFMYKKFG